MDNVVSIMKSWSTNLRYWERYLLQFVLANQSISDELILNAYRFFKEENGLLDSKSVDKPEINFVVDPISQDKEIEKVLLLEISNCTNVNALAEHQRLTFCPNLTIVFGGNGSGKSGYARVLANIGFTRGDSDVLGNIYSQESNSPSADILISSNGQERQLHFCINDQCKELAKLYVFDSTSVKVQLEDENQFSFTPLGLDYFQLFANQTDKVRQLLNEEIDARAKRTDFSPFFQGSSRITDLISRMSGKVDPKELDSLTRFVEADAARLDTIPVEIANLSPIEINKQIENLEKTVTSLSSLIQRIDLHISRLGDNSVSEMNISINAFNELNLQMEDLGKGVSFIGQFTDQWKDFAVSTHSVALNLGKPNYPQSGDSCILCRRELDNDAVNNIRALIDYVGKISSIGIDEANKNLQRMSKEVEELRPVETEIGFSLVVSFIKKSNQNLNDDLTTLLQNLSHRKRKFLDCLAARKPIVDVLPLQNCRSNLQLLLSDIKTTIGELQTVIPEDRILALQIEKIELEHRKILTQLIPSLIREIEDTQWVEKARKVTSSTLHITKKQSEVFKVLVTDTYVNKFIENLNALGRPLRVKIATSGQKGKTKKRLVLSSQASASSTKIEKVLSEGEKRAVALADFLTEVDIDPESQGMVLDDPVTSLDFEWRQLIAENLVQRAKSKQVIVLTHDLPFVYCLLHLAEKVELEPSIHYIRSEGEGSNPGHVYLNDSPALEKDYLKATKARELYTKAKTVSGSEQLVYLKSGYGALRSSYEALVIFNLFNEVVSRFEKDISVGKLKDIVWDQEIVNDIQKTYGRLSGFIFGHLSSDNFSVGEITAKDLLNEIEHFEQLKKRLNLLKEKDQKSRK